MSLFRRKEKPVIAFLIENNNFCKWLKKSMKDFKQDHVFLFFENENEVWDAVEDKEIDVIFAEIFMEDFDGLQFFESMRKEHPEIIRILLIDQHDESFVLKAYDCAHQLLDKMTTPNELMYTIDRALRLGKLLANEDLRRIISGLDSLPVMSDTYLRLIRAIQSPHTSFKEIGKIISEDASLTAKILQIANSPIYASHEKITNPMQAAVLLGINTIKALIIFVAVFSRSNTGSILKRDIKKEIENHSFRVAEKSREVIAQLSCDKETIDSVFICGLLHDFGKIILLEIKEEYINMLKTVKDINSTILERERDLFGTTHTEIGAYLLGLWGLPDSIIEAVGNHHNPIQVDEEFVAVVAALHIANVLETEQDVKDIADFRTMDYMFIEEHNYMSVVEAAFKLSGKE